MAYAELHAHSGFSFLDGSSDPEELVAEADRLGLAALALTDHHGFYGVVRFAEAARVCGLPTVFGSEVTLAPASPRTGEPDPTGAHLVLLARDPDGYARLSTVLADAHLAGGEKGKPIFTLDALARAAGDHWLVLSGCRKGAVPAALMDAGPRAASREVGRLVDAFGRANVALELWDHGDPLDTARNDALARLAVEWDVDAVATNNVHYATPAGFRLATTLAAVRARRPLAELEGWLPSAPAACLRSAGEQARRFARWPGVVERAAELGRACAFDLRLVAPRLPDFPVPAGMDEQGYLRQLVTEGALARYGPPGAERVPGAWKQIEHELAVIGQLGFAGYFLVVWDIARVCRRLDIYCQGRGSAANSAVCYALGVTNVDAVDLGLLFERFLSPARDGPPDIDVDIESGRREEVIQYVYERYGRRHAAQVANVITYRPRSAVRDVGKAFGFTPEQVDAWAAGIDAGHGRGISSTAAAVEEVAEAQGGGVPALVAELAAEVLDRPRHLGIHSAGMVLCDRPVVEVCPVEWGRMPGRSVLQWDKDDCAAIGLVKFDLLGLGMLEALHRMVDLVRAFDGVEVDLGQLPQEDAVYDLLCRADTVGVFQVESRAQMGTLPRVRAAHLLRHRHRGGAHPPRPHPGPRGEPLHPPAPGRGGRHLPAPAARADPRAHARGPALPGAADGDGRGHRRLQRGRRRRAAPGHGGQALGGAHGEDAGAPLRRDGGARRDGRGGGPGLRRAGRLRQLRLPRVALGLVRAPGVLVGLAEAALSSGVHGGALELAAHGVLVAPVAGGRRPPARGARAPAAREPLRGGGVPRSRRVRRGRAAPRAGVGARGGRRHGGTHRGRPALGRRRGPGAAGGGDPGPARDAGRRRRARPRGILGRGDGEAGGEVETRGTPASRRRLVWAAGAAAQGTPDRLPGVVVGAEAPPLPEPSLYDSVGDDLWALGLAPERTAMHLARERLEAMDVRTAVALEACADGERASVAGVVTHRQHPETARGAVFVNLEDETGHVNVVFSRGAWARWKHVARHAPVLLIRGRVRKGQGAVSFDAERVEALVVGTAVPASRDFR